jgi:hypothetical protein
MKVFQLSAIILLLSFSFSVTTGITSCTKTKIEYDTTYLSIHDTTTIQVHDTTVIKDTTNCNLKRGLVAYFSFVNGNLSDSSGYGNNIIFNNATKTTDRFGNPNNAYLFNGTSSYMQIKNSSSLNPDSITIYAIVNVNGFYSGTCSGNNIVTKGDHDDINGFYLLQFTDYSVVCGIPNLNNETFGGSFGNNIPKGTAAGINSVTPIKKGQWYYVAFTYDHSVAKMYINGDLVNSASKDANFTANSKDVFIGRDESSLYPYYFNGTIDEIRIYNRALSACEISCLVNSTN